MPIHVFRVVLKSGFVLTYRAEGMRIYQTPAGVVEAYEFIGWQDGPTTPYLNKGEIAAITKEEDPQGAFLKYLEAVAQSRDGLLEMLNARWEGGQSAPAEDFVPLPDEPKGGLR